MPPRKRQVRWALSAASLLLVAIALKLLLPRSSPPQPTSPESSSTAEKPKLSPHSPTDLQARRNTAGKEASDTVGRAPEETPKSTQPGKEFFLALRNSREVAQSDDKNSRESWIAKLLQEPGVQSFHQGSEKLHLFPQVFATQIARRDPTAPGELFREGGLAFRKGEVKDGRPVVFNETTGQLGVLTGVVTISGAEPNLLQSSLNLLRANGVQISVAREMPEQGITILRHEGKPHELVHSMQVLRSRGLFQTKLEILSQFAGAN